MSDLADLIGPRSMIQPIHTWLTGWSSNAPPALRVAVITGEAGVGKTTVATALCKAVGFEPEIECEGDFSRLNEISRKPTFFGDRRAAILDDADNLSQKIWNQILKIGDLPFPLIIIASDPEQIFWQIRRSALCIHINTPTQVQIRKFLEIERDRIGSDHSDQDLDHIASLSISWRSATLTLLTTPPNFDLDQEIRIPNKIGRSQIRAILSGSHTHNRNGSHPMALISTALWNGCKPDHVSRANALHSLSWNIEGLSKISDSYLTTLRCFTQDNPPFRTRKIGSHHSLKRVGL